MKKGNLQAACAALFLILICINPVQALLSARTAFAMWATSVAPALLPFLIVVPALTSKDVLTLYSRFAGRLMRPFFGCPAEMIAPACVGWLAGSPAGAAAASQLAQNKALTQGELTRGALLASGASPMFLISSVGVGMLGSPAAGWLLVRSQIIAVLVSGVLMRKFFPDTQTVATDNGARGGAFHPVLNAIMNLLSICGYMAFFSVLAGQLAYLMGDPVRTPLMAMLELAGGCGEVAAAPLLKTFKLPLLSAVGCFGGLSVCAQCLSFLNPFGVNGTHYILGKLLHAALAFLITRAQMYIAGDTVPVFSAQNGAFDPACVSALLAAILLLMVLLPALYRNRVSKG